MEQDSIDGAYLGISLLFLHLKIWSCDLKMEGMILEMKGLSTNKCRRKTRKRRGGWEQVNPN